MKIRAILENISSQQRGVGQLPADFRPAQTSPQLNGPYPGRNATRGYLVGEDQDMSEGHADQQRKIFKKNGKPVGEIGIDRESSPGVGQYYMKHYASGTDNSGYDSFEDARDELLHLVKQGVAEGLNEFAPAGGDGGNNYGGDLHDILMAYISANEPDLLKDFGQDVVDSTVSDMVTMGTFDDIDPNDDNDLEDALIQIIEVLHDGRLDPDQQGVAEAGVTWHGTQSGVQEATGDKPFDQMMSKIKKGTKQQARADRRERDAASRERARAAFGPSPADKLSIRPDKGVAEAGPFSYGKAPRKGSVADLAAKKRKEQEKGKPPIEPKDQMVGVAKVTKGVAEGGYNPLDDERREQSRMDAERRKFKRDELAAELGGEEQRAQQIMSGTWYIVIDGQVWRRGGQPVTFPGRDAARRAGQTIKNRTPERTVTITTRIPAAENSDLAEAPLDIDLIKRAQGGMSGTNQDPDSERFRDQPYGYRDRAKNTFDPMARLDKGAVNSIERALGIKWPKHRAWQGTVKVDESRDQHYLQMFREAVAAGMTSEDVLTTMKRRLGDYLQDVATAIKKDPDLVNKIPKTGDQIGPAVRTIKTDDGHEIRIHGNEDDGFRISIRNRTIPSRFKSLDEAEIATEMYCARRRQATQLRDDYVDEA